MFRILQAKCAKHMRSDCDDTFHYDTRRLVTFPAVLFLGLHKSRSGAEGNRVFRVTCMVESCSVLQDKFVEFQERKVLGHAGSLLHKTEIGLVVAADKISRLPFLALAKCTYYEVIQKRSTLRGRLSNMRS